MPTQIKERPILFSGPMVRAILENRKSQTRRILKPQPAEAFLARGVEGVVAQWPVQDGVRWFMSDGMSELVKSPYGKPGDKFWVRETFLNNALDGYPTVRFYRADDADKPQDRNWKPSIFMPRLACRITLEIIGVRVERLHEISEEDARAEGISATVEKGFSESDGAMINSTRYKDGYSLLWESINGKGSWAKNPYVWVIKFKKL